MHVLPTVLHVNFCTFMHANIMNERAKEEGAAWIRCTYMCATGEKYILNCLSTQYINVNV